MRKFIFIFSVLFISGVFSLLPFQVKAETLALSGYAWSDVPENSQSIANGAGWISFAGPGYGVSVDTVTGRFSGYAWSEHYGWLSFNDGTVSGSNNLSGCPSGTCRAEMNPSTGALSGWAKFLNGSPTGSYDGWVKLGTYGATYNFGTQEFTGYAWGHDLVGWVSLRGATYGVDTDVPTIVPDLTPGDPSPTTAVVGGNTNLSAIIYNIGNASTGGSFVNFFRVATATGGGGSITDLSPVSMSALSFGDNNTTTQSYIFPSVGTYSIRVCADNNASFVGVINEGANEGNNCSNWVDVVVATGINGACSAVHYNCNVGTSINPVNGVSAWTWTCQSPNGGTNVPCSQSKKRPVIIEN